MLSWVNVAVLRMEQQVGRPVLVEFWDCCRPHSLRTLPYVKAWHDRYVEAADDRRGLRVISIHAPGFAPGRDKPTVKAAVARLGIEHPVALDPDFAAWKQYDVPGWPARYLFDQTLHLVEYHHGEGGYLETEMAIQDLLGIEDDLVAPMRPEDEPDAEVVAPTPEHAGGHDGPYAAGAVWAVVSGPGELLVDGGPIRVEHAGAICLRDHGRHVEASIAVEATGDLELLATVFTPGIR